MALSAAPKGLSPVGTVTGAAYNEQGRLYYIANDASNTYAIGDIVVAAAGADSNGIPAVTKYVQGTTTVAPLGVIVGIQPADAGVSLQGTNLDLTKVYLNKSAGNRYVYVVDDPNVVFAAQFDITGVAQTKLNNLCSTNQAADQTTLSQSSPLSSTALTGPATTHTANTTILQIIGSYQDPINQGALSSAATSSTAVPYLTVLVKWNQHKYFGAAVGV